MHNQSSNPLQLGKWSFNEINLNNFHLYSKYIKETQYPANLWSSNFSYLWASSQSSKRKVLWRVVDDMLVTFGHSSKNSLYLYCLPFGKGNPDDIVEVLYTCLTYCYQWNSQENNRTFVRLINEGQLEFLRAAKKFDDLFRLKRMFGIERHLGVNNLVTLSGKDFSSLRYKINKFHRDNPNAKIRSYTDRDYDELMDLGTCWSISAGKKYTSVFDKVYYKEFVKHYNELKQIILVIQIGENIVGMIAGGELPTGQAWGSIIKFKENLPGLSETLTIEFAREINRLNPHIEYINTGSDLGPGGLRDYKLKFRPVLNLKRYKVYLK